VRFMTEPYRTELRGSQTRASTSDSTELTEEDKQSVALKSDNINGGNGLGEITCNGTAIAHEDHLKYLGMFFQSVNPLSFDLHIRKMAASACKAVYKFRSLRSKLGSVNLGRN
jgi:hypothetical protein